MTDARHTQPRCPICRRPSRHDGCQPRNCSFRPSEGTAEYAANAVRREAYDRLIANGSFAPTLDDVDAELQPKGLPVIELDSPAWAQKDWLKTSPYTRERALMAAGPVTGNPSIITAQVWGADGKSWAFSAGIVADKGIRGDGHPTPEAAQAACEAAIIAAWRNR